MKTHSSTHQLGISPRILIFLVPLLLVSITACDQTETDQALLESQTIAPRVSVISVESESIIPQISSFGSISFRRKADITPAIEGIIAKILVEESDQVRQSQLLAQIENVQLEVRREQAEAGLQSAQAGLRLAETRYEEGRRQFEGRLLSLKKSQNQIEQKKIELEELEEDLLNKQELFELDGISAEELESLQIKFRGSQTEYEGLLTDYEISLIGLRDEDISRAGFTVPDNVEARNQILIDLNTRTLAAEVEVARSKLATAQAEMESVRLLVEELEIRSPFSGIVGARMLSEGERIQAGTQLFTIFTDDEVYAVFPVQESKLRYLEENQEVSITVPSMDEASFSGTIDVISPTIDPQSGNIQIRALIQNPNRNLRPGMFIESQVIIGRAEDKILVPNTSFVQKQGNNASVFLIKNGRPFLRNVQIIDEGGAKVEVLEGLEVGDQLIIEPPTFLREGMEVEVINAQ